MKINKNTIYLIAFIIVVLFSLAHKFIFAGTLNWKSYSNPEIDYSFKYPSNMRICENIDNSYVAVIDNISHVRSVRYGDFGTIQGKKYTKQTLSTPLTCDNFTMENSRYSVITDLNVETSETDIKNWLDKLRTGDTTKEGELPRTGLLSVEEANTWKFVNYNNKLISNQPNNSVAEVIYLGDESTQYLILSNNRIYALKFEPMMGAKSLPLKLILKTLKFK